MSKTFENPMRALAEVKAHREGRIELPSVRIEIDTPDVREIRKKLKLSQEKFAGRFGFSLPAARAWEQKKRLPDISARHYLRVIERNPKASYRMTIGQANRLGYEYRRICQKDPWH